RGAPASISRTSAGRANMAEIPFMAARMFSPQWRSPATKCTRCAACAAVSCVDEPAPFPPQPASTRQTSATATRAVVDGDGAWSPRTARVRSRGSAIAREPTERPARRPAGSLRGREVEERAAHTVLPRAERIGGLRDDVGHRASLDLADALLHDPRALLEA